LVDVRFKQIGQKIYVQKYTYNVRPPNDS